MQACTDEFKALLIKTAASYGIEVTADQAQTMLCHVDLVIEKNKVMNLTRIVEPEAALMLHVVDSLLLVPALRQKGYQASTRLLDIGTGAGFPGVPLAIATGMRTTMIDSVGKKVAAVQEFVEELGLGAHVTVEKDRAETFALSHAHEFDFVTARAVAPLAVLVEYATPLLVKNGLMVVSKAAVQDEEWNSALATAQVCGLDLVSRETFELPEGRGTREIIAFQRARAPKVKLPRTPGAAKHKPLA